MILGEERGILMQLQLKLFANSRAIYIERDFCWAYFDNYCGEDGMVQIVLRWNPVCQECAKIEREKNPVKIANGQKEFLNT